MKDVLMIPIIALMSLLLAVLPINAFPYCVGNDLYENITANGNVIELFDKRCIYGCLENLTAFGDGCSPSPQNSLVIGFGLIGFFIFIIYTLPRVLKKRKGKR